MPASSFLKHKERKHSLIDDVKYQKLSIEATTTKSNPLEMVKCRYCPNKIPNDAMERHMQRSHIGCHLCGKIILKSNFDRHMEKKHDQSPLCSTNSSSVVSMDQLMAEVFEPLPKPKVPEFIYITEYQLGSYLKQGRVYTKNGFLYLRNV